jgi:hypothetical protein
MVVAEALPDYEERAMTLRTLERTHGTALATLQKLRHDSTVCKFCMRDANVDLPASHDAVSSVHLKDFLSDDVVMEVTNNI